MTAPGCARGWRVLERQEPRYFEWSFGKRVTPTATSP